MSTFWYRLVSPELRPSTRTQTAAKTHVHILKGKNSWFLVCTYELLKHNHLQLQLRILSEWFTGKTLLNTQHLNLMGCVILLDNPMPGCQSLVKFARQMKIYLYTPIPMLVNMIWLCCLCPNSTYVTLWSLLN